MARIKRREAILLCIKKNIEDHGYPPTVREIADKVGLSSTSTVHGHLDRLEKEGYIKRDPNKPRTILIVDRESSSLASKHEGMLITQQYRGSFVKQFNINDKDYIVIKENANEGIAMAIRTVDGLIKVTEAKPILQPQDSLIGAIVGVFKTVQ